MTVETFNMSYNMTMTMVNIFEAKAKLSDLLERAAAGERILICKRNHPVAELRPVAEPRKVPRPIGKARGQFNIPPAFFDPLDADDADAFDGGEVFPPLHSGTSLAAERGSRGANRRRRRT